MKETYVYITYVYKANVNYGQTGIYTSSPIYGSSATYLHCGTYGEHKIKR